MMRNPNPPKHVPALFAVVLSLAVRAAAQASDPLAAQTFSQAYLWREVLWQSESGRTEGWGGRGLLQLGLGRVGVALRADVGGLPEAFSLEDPRTFRSASGYLAVHLNMIAREGAVVGPTVLVGRAISLEDGLASAPTAGRITAGAGIRVATATAAGYLAVGTHEALGGACLLWTLHLPLTSRLAFVADGATTTGGRAYLRLGMAVSLAEGGQ